MLAEALMSNFAHGEQRKSLCVRVSVGVTYNIFYPLHSNFARFCLRIFVYRCVEWIVQVHICVVELGNLDDHDHIHVHVHVAKLGNLDEFVYLDKSGDVDGPRRVNYLGHKAKNWK